MKRTRKCTPKASKARKKKRRTPTIPTAPPLIVHPILSIPPASILEEDEDEEIGFHDVDARWFQATNFEDLLALNIEFIKGKLLKTPYHDGPLETNDKKFINKLVQLNKFGLLTHDGQTTECEYAGFIEQGKTDVMGPSKPAYYYDEEGRGYLSFYVDLLENVELAISLLDQLKYSGLIYAIHNFQTNTQESNIKYFNLTRDRSNLTKQTLLETKWRDYTNLRSPMDRKLLWDEENIDPILENTIHFTVALPDYCKGDLESMLLKMCRVAKKTGKLKKYNVKWRRRR